MHQVKEKKQREAEYKAKMLADGSYGLDSYAEEDNKFDRHVDALLQEVEPEMRQPLLKIKYMKEPLRSAAE